VEPHRLEHGIPSLPDREMRYRFRAGRIRARILYLLVTCTCLFPPELVAQAKTASEYEIKAAFLYNFAKFVEWPAASFANSKQPLNICVLGPDPFGHFLDEAVLGKSIEGHPVSVTRGRLIQDMLECHILFVGGSQRLSLADLLNKLRGKNVLLVGESEDFAFSGGTVQFVLEGNHVRFVINPDAAERAGLKISSKLLALAVVVHDSQPREAEKR
jgi:YfiR/HmsC-like